MTSSQFWDIVDRVHVASAGDMEKKCELLAKELRKLAPAEVQSFDEHFTQCWYRAYTEDLWGAAYLIGGGCSDDKFMDFRSALISMGRTVLENAMANPDSLAELELDRDSMFYQGYQYVTPIVYEEMTGRKLSEVISHSHPKETSGTPFEEWAMSPRYPKLAAKYGWNDSAQLYLKERRDRAEHRKREAERLANFLFESGIIPLCGLVPPPRILRSVLRLGHLPPETGKQFSWEPFELDEDVYWLLWQTKEFERWRDLHGIRVLYDKQAPASDDYASWVSSLRERGLM